MTTSTRDHHSIALGHINFPFDTFRTALNYTHYVDVDDGDGDNDNNSNDEYTENGLCVNAMKSDRCDNA